MSVATYQFLSTTTGFKCSLQLLMLLLLLLPLAAAGPCQQPQIQHLLRMSGGIVGFDNCAYKPTEWQTQYCL